MVEKNIDSIFYQLEEKIVVLLSEREDLLTERESLIREIRRLTEEQSGLKIQEERNKQKLEGIVSLLESISMTDKTAAATTSVNTGAVKLDLIQG
jgi:chromosome segregation ATPase